MVYTLNLTFYPTSSRFILILPFHLSLFYPFGQIFILKHWLHYLCLFRVSVTIVSTEPKSSLKFSRYQQQNSNRSSPGTVKWITKHVWCKLLFVTLTVNFHQFYNIQSWTNNNTVRHVSALIAIYHRPSF